MMANITIPKTIPPKVITKFLGLNENVDGGEYGLKLGEATKQINYRITSNNQLKQREGFWKVFNLTAGNVQGMWYGKLAGTAFFLFCHDGHLYSGTLSNGTKVDLGTLTDAPTRFMAFGTKVYIHNGHEYKSFDGVIATPSTNSIQTVAGYRPKIAIGAPPSGGGTLFEQTNLLTGAKHMTFTPAGSATVYQLPETEIDSVDYVYKNGLLKTLTTDYTVNLTLGQVTFVSGPTGSVADSIDIGWTKGTGNRSYIEGCRFSMDYSGQTDTRLFLWGNEDYKNRTWWTGLANGIPSAEYFEALSYNDVGSGQYAITDIVKQYDRQKIFLEDSSYYSYYSTQEINGLTVADFPTFELNEEIGNVAFGQAQVVKNSPLTLFSGVHSWNSSTVRDQTNEDLISQRVQDSLMVEDLTEAITFHWHKNKEYGINIGSVVWIYNYLNNTWYKFDNITATCFLVVNDELYFGADGAIHKFDTTKRSDNGVAINAVWEMGFYDGDAEWLTKYMNNVWVSIKPSPKTLVQYQTVTDNDGHSVTQELRYSMLNFNHIDFNHFSFLTSYAPRPFYVEVEAQGFCYFKIILKNSSLVDTATVLSITLPMRYGGKVGN